VRQQGHGLSPDAIPSPYFFAYGTLMRDFDGQWQKNVGANLIGIGWITARLYYVGDYPGAKLADPGSGYSVKGELYKVRDLDRALKILDKYEEFLPSAPAKSLFVRDLVPVKMERGRTRSAWVYLYNRTVDESRLIPSGDYRDWVSAHHRKAALTL
jgi:gamma-glutamylcyclotransferase (GGCT)/AIG2-like uncharacterized protein YtfP